MAIAKAQVIIQLKDQLTDGTRRATRELSALGKAAHGLKGAFRFAGELNQAAEGMARFGSMARSALEAPLKTSMDFEDQMARVGALADATGGQMTTLTETARSLGRDTRFSATEAAQGMEFLAQAGFKTSEMVAAMPGLLATAAANASDLGRTAEIAADSMNGFGMKAEQMGRVGDVLTKAGAESSTNLDMIGESLKYVAPYARTAGQTLEQTAAAVALLANVGIKGSQAGTSLRAMMERLAAPKGRGKGALALLGVDPKDKDGNLRPIQEILKQIDAEILRKKMGSGDKLELYDRIFGVDASTAAAELISQAGNGAFDAMVSKMEQAAGTNEKMAARMNATTKGFVEEMNGAFEDLNIELGDALGPEIRDLGGWAKTTATEFRLWATEHPGTIASLGKIAIQVAAVATALGAVAAVGPAAAAVFAGLKVVAFPLVAIFKGLSAMLMATSLGAIAMTAPLTLATALTVPMIALGLAVAGVAYAFGSWIDSVTGASDWIANLIAQINGLNDAKDKLMNSGQGKGTQTYADGTVLDDSGKVVRKGTEWERHAAGMTIQQWDTKKKEESDAKNAEIRGRVADAAKNAEVAMRVEVDIKDNRTHVKTTSKSKGANVSVGSGPMMPGAM
jgi:TP901 family phage tail tape measure protein